VPHFISLRHQVIDTAQKLARMGLNQGTSGNVSARCSEDAFLVTPSGVEPAALRPSDLALVYFDGQSEGPYAPSSEWHIHRDLLAQRRDLGAVIHTHAPYCTTLAVLDRPIPPFHYMVAKAGGSDIRLAPYATYGTPELSAHALAAMEGRKACLLSHHGMLAAGKNLDAALKLTVEVEELARIYWQAIQVGEPSLLSADEMALVVEKFKTYGSAQPSR
jgi:L-fuculose-phosphate aldolase